MELPAKSGSERQTGQKVVSGIMVSGALPSPALDAVFAAAQQRRSWACWNSIPRCWACAPSPPPARRPAAWRDWPPGSVLPLTPQGAEAATTARLFMHWAQKDRAGPINLDLSAMACNAEVKTVGKCTFSELRAPGMVHSGDLRSAPLPVGATEYIALDLEQLRKAGATLVIAPVYPYTSPRCPSPAWNARRAG